MFITKFKNILFYFFSIVFVILSAIVTVFFYYGRTLPSELTLLDYSPPVTTRIYASDNKLMEEYAIERRIMISYENIPEIVKAAFIIAEDKEFYNHAGLSIQSLLRAIIENTSKRVWYTKPAGGSTITQQVAKNLLVGNERSLSRKIREAIMAFRIESSISKNKILEIYLNHLYLGKGCYGIVEACNYYFNKSIDKITPEEAAFLASLPSAPSVYVNMADTTKLVLKRNAILSQMYEAGFINKEQLLDSLSRPINLKISKTKLNVPYFSEEVRRIFLKHIPTEQFLKGGYNITTTMDWNLQSIAQKCLEDGLIEHAKTTTWEGPLKSHNLEEIEKNLPKTTNKIIPVTITAIEQDTITAQNSSETAIKFKSSQKLSIGDTVLCRQLENGRYELFYEPKATGGIIVMEADTGNILAMSGGYSFDIGFFNCATQAKRQPGSSIKPFIYAAALENDFDEFDEIEDKAISIKLENGTYYTPHNYSQRVYGKMPLRDGLIYSRNLATINLAKQVGYSKISKILKDLDLIDGKFNVSYVLGSYETTLLNLVTAFSTIINNGNMVYPRFVIQVTKQSQPATTLNDEICKRKIKKNIMSAETAATIKNMLRDTAKYGTANKLAYVFDHFNNIDVGGKTGTTNDFKDAWFIGYITKGAQTIIVGVFVGYKIPKSLGEHASGAKIALPIFLNFLKKFSKN